MEQDRRKHAVSPGENGRSGKHIAFDPQRMARKRHRAIHRSVLLTTVPWLGVAVERRRWKASVNQSLLPFSPPPRGRSLSTRPLSTRPIDSPMAVPHDVWALRKAPEVPRAAAYGDTDDCKDGERLVSVLVCARQKGGRCQLGRCEHARAQVGDIPSAS